jgi:phenylacetate-CoA ligase
MLKHAVRSVPYYRKRYGGLPLQSVDDLQRFDFVDRQILSDGFDEFKSETINPAKYELGTTGGTSGAPLRLLLPRNRYLVEWGAMFALWRKTGYRGQIRAVLRNHRLPKSDLCSRPLTRELQFDNFRLTDDYLGFVYETMEKRRIAFLHAYPSAAYRFASFVEREKLPLNHLKVILSGSENVYPHYRQLITDRLGIRFYSWYGHSERLVLAGQCQGSDYYHVEPRYGWFELVDKNGCPVREIGQEGEIVGTTLNNFGMPLIRYRTGDHAVLAGDYCPVCRRKVTLLRDIRGRWSGERIFRLDKSFVTTTALNVHDEVLVQLRGVQFEQHRPGHLLVRIVPGPGFSRETVTKLTTFYADRLGVGSQVEVEVGSALKRRENGKFLLLHRGISNLEYGSIEK